jgi:DNA-binding protein HU-beta
MNKKQFIDALAEKNGITKKEAEVRLTSVIELIEEVTAKEKLQIVGFGNFESKFVPGREGVSKLHGVEKPWKTEDSYKPVFHAGKEFENKVNGLV